MKRLEGMIYGGRLASEQLRERKENPLKVVEIRMEAAVDPQSNMDQGGIVETCGAGQERREVPSPASTPNQHGCSCNLCPGLAPGTT